MLDLIIIAQRQLNVYIMLEFIVSELGLYVDALFKVVQNVAVFFFYNLEHSRTVRQVGQPQIQLYKKLIFQPKFLGHHFCSL